MKREPFLVVTAVTLMFVAAGIVCPPCSLAQEVEIEVAGPWSYAADPSDPLNRVLLMTPNTPDHQLDIFSGGDVQNVAGALHPHVGHHYQLDVPTFDHTKCSTPPPPPPTSSGPYPITIDPAVVKNKIDNGTGFFAISLPIPCRYESYLEARAKIDTGSISFATQEKSYSVWMVLHYAVSSAVLQTYVKGTADDGTPYGFGSATNNLAFSGSTQHPPPTAAPAISVVLYNVGMGVEDPICDEHSANSFDEVVKTFWGQTNLKRVFPELYDSGARPREQAHRYNYSICVQMQASARMNTESSQVQRFIDLITSIRAQLSESLPKEAKTKVKTLRADLTDYWHGRLPDLIQDDLDSIDKAIDRAIESQNSVVVDSQSVLALTMYLLLPGRTDCHAAQVNINAVVH